MGRDALRSLTRLTRTRRSAGPASVALPAATVFASAVAATFALVATAHPAGSLEGLGAGRPRPAIAHSVSIVGTVSYDGPPPDPDVFSIAHDAFCVVAHGSETISSNRLVVNDNGALRWVFVYIREAVVGSLPVGEPEPVTLDKVGCVYEPRVLGIQAGATIRIVNSDDTIHTAQMEAANNQSFNIALPQSGMDIVRVLANPEIMIPVRCNVHPWTQAYIGVVPHAFFAVSGEDGNFVIDGVPAGAYVLEAWHELLGRQTLRVVVAEGEDSDLQITFATRN